MPVHGCCFPGTSAAGCVKTAYAMGIEREEQDALILQGHETVLCCSVSGYTVSHRSTHPLILEDCQLPPSLCCFFIVVFCQDFISNPCLPPDIFSCLSACGGGPVWSLRRRPLAIHEHSARLSFAGLYSMGFFQAGHPAGQSLIS